MKKFSSVLKMPQPGLGELLALVERDSPKEETFETFKERYDRHDSCLDAKTNSFFTGSPMTRADRAELLYAIDTLTDIMATSHFRDKRILETPDTLGGKPSVHNHFNSRPNPKDPTNWKIKSVGSPTIKLLEEFFHHNYFTVIFRLLHANSKGRVAVVMSGNTYIFNLSVLTPHPMFGVLDFIELKTKRTLRLPFFLERLHPAFLLCQGPKDWLVNLHK